MRTIKLDQVWVLRESMINRFYLLSMEYGNGRRQLSFSEIEAELPHLPDSAKMKNFLNMIKFKI